MDSISLFFTISSLFVLVLAALVVWSQRSRVLRWMSVVIALVTIPLLYWGAVDLLSRARPITFSFFKEKVLLEGYYLENKIALYVLTREENKPPRFYVLDWDKNMEKIIDELLRALEVQGRTGQRVVIDMTRYGVADDELVFSNVPLPDEGEK